MDTVQVWCTLTFLLLCPIVARSRFNLTILHTNDVHARVEQTNKYGGVCSTEDEKEGKCYGGVARRFTLIQQMREKYPEALLLDAGDEYQGTLWFTHYGGNATAYFMNQLGYNAMSFGNHEFDNGVTGLMDFLRIVSFPILACNIDDSREPKLRGMYKPSIVKLIKGQKIGIIGFITKETSYISNAGNLIFLDEVDSIRREAKNLVAQGVNIIIALGHAGFNVDKVIANNIKEIDVVIGGHTNTFLYTGTPPSSETAEGDYPHVVNQASGRKVLVVQDYAFGKYLGFLHVTFNNMGEVETWSGNPILLDKNVAEDKPMKANVAIWKRAVESVVNVTAGKTFVFLQGDRKVCRVKECNMGNFIADAILYQNRKTADSVTWSDAQAALINAGGIRASFSPGDLKVSDVLQLHPFRNTLEIIVVKGAVLLQILENSVSKIEARSGRFLQVSGIQVTYDISKPVGRRVVEVWVMCTKCTFPHLKLLNHSEEYSLIMPSFIVAGGDQFSMISPNLIRHHILGTLLTDAITEYLKGRSPVTAATERRIIFQRTATVSPGTVTCGGNSRTMVWVYCMVTLAAFLVACTDNGHFSLL